MEIKTGEEQKEESRKKKEEGKDKIGRIKKDRGQSDGEKEKEVMKGK